MKIIKIKQNSTPCSCVDCPVSCPVDDSVPENDGVKKLLIISLSIALMGTLWGLSLIVVGLKFPGMSRINQKLSET